MMKHLWFSVGLSFTWLVFISAHLFFLQTFLYWNIWWLDLLMHGWGGALVVTSWYFVRALGVFPRLFTRLWNRPLTMLGLAMLGWEIFKYVSGGVTADNYLLDTALDLLFGLGGGLIVFFINLSRTIRER